MKTFVVSLDPHDDLTSVRDKMSWAKSARLLLVYPSHSHILARPLDLRLLQRHAVSLGGQLAIVVQRGEIRQTAWELGIPVFNKVAVAQRRSWQTVSSQKPHRRAPRPNLRKMRREAIPNEAYWRSLLGFRLFFFSLGVLAVLILLLLFFPTATVVLTPQTQMQSLSITASANSLVTSPSLTGSLPAHLTYTVLEQSRTIKVTGSLITPDTPATGILRFSNLTTGEVNIPSGTKIRSTANPPERFATMADAVVKAGAGMTQDVSIQAVEPGSSGNLPAGALVAIEGDLGTRLSVTNPNPTTGGTDRTAPVQTANDRSRLRSALVSAILDQCQISLPKTILPGDIYFPNTLAAGQVLSEIFFPAEGQTGDTLSLSLNMQCQARYALAADVQTLARQALDANLPSGFEPAAATELMLEPSVPATDSDGITHWQVKAQRIVHARLDPLETTQLILGHRRIEAGRRLTSSLHLEKAPSIILNPAWWPWLPAIPFRIMILIKG
jgi:hypothetical protein